jgi:regulatory protein
MNTITAIEPQKKRGDRRSIFVDGQFVAGAHEEVIIALNLRVGQTFDKERLAALIRTETVRKAQESALRLLDYRDRAVSEIRKRLIGNDFPEDIVEEIIDHLSRIGYLDDEKFSREWVRSRTVSKPMGKARLNWELRAKGVEQSMVEEALESLDDNTEYELALAAARKKVEKADPNDQAFRNRLVSFLRRRGFGWEVINRVVDELCPGDQDLM